MPKNENVISVTNCSKAFYYYYGLSYHHGVHFLQLNILWTGLALKRVPTQRTMGFRNGWLHFQVLTFLPFSPTHSNFLKAIFSWEMCHFLLQLNVLVLKQKKVMILFTNAVVLLQHIYSWLVAQKSHITSAYYFLPVRFLDMTRNREAVRLKIRYSETRLKLESRQRVGKQCNQLAEGNTIQQAV